MTTKTFNIGEYSKCGVITVEILKKSAVKLIFRNWDFSKGSTKSSNQKNSPIVYSTVCNNSYNEIYEELIDDTTDYYAEQILNWINSKLPLAKQYNF